MQMFNSERKKGKTPNTHQKMDVPRQNESLQLFTTKAIC